MSGRQIRKQPKTLEQTPPVLHMITPRQQMLIEALLAGQTITQSAALAGVSRRAAIYWMNDPDHPVRMEYEKQRTLLYNEMTTRVLSIHTKALQALDDLLSPTSPPFMRLGALRMLYASYLHELFPPRPAQPPIPMVQEAAETYHKETWEQGMNQSRLYDDRGQERIVDEDE